jgi:hypothetical protein
MMGTPLVRAVPIGRVQAQRQGEVFTRRIHGDHEQLMRRRTAPELCPGFPVRDEDFEGIVTWKRTAKRDWKAVR